METNKQTAKAIQTLVEQWKGWQVFSQLAESESKSADIPIGDQVYRITVTKTEQEQPEWQFIESLVQQIRENQRDKSNK